VSDVRAHDTRTTREQRDAHFAHELQHANMRARVITTRDATRVARRKCLTFTREYVSMHVMDNSNAAVARGEKGSSTRFGSYDRSARTAFTGCNMHTAEAFEIAASIGMEVSAHAGFMPAVS
jgi:nucleoid DNA-binding protein